VCAHFKRYLDNDSVIIDFVLDFLLTITEMYFFSKLNIYSTWWFRECTEIYFCLFVCLFTFLCVCNNSFWLMAIQFKFSCNKGHPWPRSYGNWKYIYLCNQPALSLLKYKSDSYPWGSALVTNLRHNVTSGAYEFTPG
jgi:hypothetical protein